MFNSFTVDGMTWDMPCKITREAQITPSEISGMMLDKSYFNDVIGTFMVYTVSLIVPLGKEDLYATLYEILTDPVSDHSFVLPYNQGVVNIVGRIETITDELYKQQNGVKIWRMTTFNIVANHPTKTYTLGEAISRGITPLPSREGIEDGAIYQYTRANGWMEIQDVDEVAF